MIKIKNTEIIIIAILAIIMGFSFGNYFLTPNIQPVSVGVSGNPNPQNTTSFQSTENAIFQFGNNSSNVEVENIDQNEPSDPTPIIQISVEKFRSNASQGPWLEADTPSGVPLDVGDSIYWKIEVINTGEVDLELEYIDYYDEVIFNLEEVVGQLPTIVQVGMTVTIKYKTRVFSGVHKNSIKVTGTYDDITVEDEDNAYYTGVRRISTSSSEKKPIFVVPEYPLGTLGSVLILLTIFAYMQRRKTSN